MTPATLFYFIAAFTILAHLGIRLATVVRKARRRRRGEIHQRSLFGRMIGTYLVLFVLAAWEGWKGLVNVHWILCFAGYGLYLMSSFLQWKALADLGVAYSPDIELRADQPLIQSGLYGWIRHPLLVGGVLESIGMTLSLNAPWTTGLSLLVFVPVIRQRWHEEEKALFAHFGESYRAYSEQVGAFFPKIARVIR